MMPTKFEEYVNLFASFLCYIFNKCYNFEITVLLLLPFTEFRDQNTSLGTCIEMMNTWNLSGLKDEKAIKEVLSESNAETSDDIR